MNTSRPPPLLHLGLVALYLLLQLSPSLAADTWSELNALPEALNWWAVSTSADGKHKTASSLSSGGGPTFFYTSSDGGTSWAQRSVSLSLIATASDASGAHVLGAVSDDGLYLSHDHGASFTKTAAPKSKWYNVAMSANGSRLFAASLDDTLFRSDGLDGPWIALNVTGTAAADKAGFYSIACDESGEKVFATTNFNSDYYKGAGKVFFSHDGGLSWNESSLPYTAGYIAIASSQSGETVYAAAYLRGVFRSLDYGRSFTRVSTMNNNQQFFDITCDYSGANLATVVFNGPLYISNDFGGNWTVSKDSDSDDNLPWRRIRSDANATSLIASTSFSGVFIGDIVTVYPTYMPSFRPTESPVDSPTAAPTYNVSYVYLLNTNTNTPLPAIAYVVVFMLICCCGLLVGLVRCRHACAYYIYSRYYNGSMPNGTSFGDMTLGTIDGYAEAVASPHPEAQVELIRPGTTAAEIEATATVLEEGAVAAVADIPVATSATVIPSAEIAPAPYSSNPAQGYEAVLESDVVAQRARTQRERAPRAQRRTIGGPSSSSPSRHPNQFTSRQRRAHGSDSEALVSANDVSLGV